MRKNVCKVTSYANRPKYANSSCNSMSKKPNNSIKNWTEDLNRHFSQRRHMDGQKAHEKMLNMTSYQRNANQNYNEISPHISQNGFPQRIHKQ